MNKSLCWSFHLGGFPDSGLESISVNGFREDRDGVRSGSANGHDDDGVRLENGKHPTLRLFFVQIAIH